jgi:hypothetical protein
MLAIENNRRSAAQRAAAVVIDAPDGMVPRVVQAHPDLAADMVARAQPLPRVQPVGAAGGMGHEAVSVHIHFSVKKREKPKMRRGNGGRKRPRGGSVYWSAPWRLGSASVRCERGAK